MFIFIFILLLNLNATITNNNLILELNYKDTDLFLENIYKKDLLIYFNENVEKNYFFPFYLYIPKTLTNKNYLLVEPNNSGSVSDSLTFHEEKAKDLIKHNYLKKIADALNTPLLVPVFIRPESFSHIYTHSLDRDSLLYAKDNLKRIDLQLINIIEYLKEFLASNNINIEDKILMNGFSASGTFVNRFTALHPGIVKVVVSGAVNGIPILPLKTYKNHNLIFPIGVFDIKELTGQEFDLDQYKKVAQYIYMGSNDNNDTLYFNECFDSEERYIITNIIGKDMINKRWTKSIELLKLSKANIQTNTYKGVGHTITKEILDDIILFFKNNTGNKFKEIKPFKYKNLKELKVVNVDALLWKNSDKIPDKFKESVNDVDFIISTKDWIHSKDYSQLREFINNAGFNFKLTDGLNMEFKINNKNLAGTISDPNINFAGFLVKLNEADYSKIKNGATYKLLPLNKNNKYKWVVSKALFLEKN